MGLFTNKIKRDDLKPGDHIYTYRAIFAYSHHGISVGSCKVVHFIPEHSSSSWSSWSPSSCSSSWTSPCSSSWYPPVSEVKDSSSSSSEASCTLPDCGYKQTNNGVTISCLDCFLNNGSLYRFEYKVNSSIFLTRFRGGTCTTATSDNSQTVIHRAMHLLQNRGFGDYDMLQNNCEDFALYCKTGLIAHRNEKGVGRSGQAYSAVSVPVAALLSSPFALLISNPVGVATVTAGMYSMTRYASDIGVRNNVIKVPVEDLVCLIGQ